MTETAKPASAALRDWATYVALFLIVALAAYLRFRGLGEDSLWRDEAASWEQAQGNLFDIISATAQDNYPPLHNLILAVSMRLFGDGEWALRLPSAILGVLNVLAIYWVGTLVGGRVAGLIAALLLALSGYHIWYSQEARMYSLLALSATFFFGTSLRLWAKPTALGALWVVVSGLALLYSHPYGTLTWASIAFAIATVTIWQPQAGGLRVTRWVAVQAVVLVAFLPWVWVLVHRAETINERGFWIPYPTPEFAIDQISKAVTGPVLLFFLSLAAAAALLRETNEAWATMLAGSHPGVAGLTVAPPVRVYTLLAWAFLPILFGLLASILTTPVFYARYLIGSLPAILLLAAVGLARFAISRLGLAAVFAVSAGLSWLGLTYYSPAQREDWRGVGEHFTETFRQDNCLVVPGEVGLPALRYYYRVPIKCAYVVSGAKGINPGTIHSNLVFLIVLGSNNRGADVLKSFPSPPWEVGGEVPFRRLNVIALIRKED